MRDSLPEKLHVKLLSDATFSRGEGTAGVVDTEIEHDEHGIPFVGGKTVKGLLRDSWLSMRHCLPSSLKVSGDRVFGPVKDFSDTCILHISDAVLTEKIYNLLRNATVRKQDKLSEKNILEAITDIRYQTAEERETGSPAIGTLRSSRVVIRYMTFVSKLTWLSDHVIPGDLKVLAMTAFATRHGGLLRNRGRGYLKITLDGDYDRTLALIRKGEGEHVL
jgi:hypothetical protein